MLKNLHYYFMTHIHLFFYRTTVNEVTRSSCLSLSALMTDLERISINSDANSLCSEPVKMYDYNDFQNENDLHKSQVNLDDLFDFCNKNTTMSLNDLCSKELTEGRDHRSDQTEDPNQRSDSPILEGIDQELAKYAKLKDLEQAYHSPTTHTTEHLFRNPDGASNPDLNSNKIGNIQLCRRSPGNGRSASEPEEEGCSPAAIGKSTFFWVCMGFVFYPLDFSKRVCL